MFTVVLNTIAISIIPQTHLLDYDLLAPDKFCLSKETPTFRVFLILINIIYISLVAQDQNFIQQIFFKVFCARYYSRCWTYSKEQTLDLCSFLILHLQNPSLNPVQFTAKTFQIYSVLSILTPS